MLAACYPPPLSCSAACSLPALHSKDTLHSNTVCASSSVLLHASRNNRRLGCSSVLCDCMAASMALIQLCSALCVWPFRQHAGVPECFLASHSSSVGAQSPQTAYDPKLVFGPKSDDTPMFVLTVGWKQAQVRNSNCHQDEPTLYPILSLS